MARSPAQDSDATLRDARASLRDQRSGGRRLSRSIGTRSAALKRANLGARIKRTLAVLVAIFIAMTAAGLVLNGIGFTGIVITFFAVIAALTILPRYPRAAIPARATLAQGDLRSLVGRTELWLESQRRALPAPAVQLVDQLGGQLDALGLQLDGLRDDVPAAAEVRKLVGEHLPELVSSYTAIPAHLRGVVQGGSTPDQQLSESLTRISGEIDSVTRQLASGAIDNLAIKTRYLDYKYGGDAAQLEDNR